MYLTGFFAERIGRLISQVGERMALTFEYIGLIFVFVAYGLVENATLAAAFYAGPYVLCHGDCDQHIFSKNR